MTEEARHQLATTIDTDDRSPENGVESLLRQLRVVTDLQSLLGELLAALAALEDADKALLLRFDGNETLTLAASAGLAPEHGRLLARLPASAHPWEEALRKSVAIGDAEIEPAFTPQPLVRAAGVRGLHAVPVLAPDGSPLGVLATLFRRPLQLSSRQERVAALYARQVAWILTSLHLREQAATVIAQKLEQVNEAEQRASESAVQAASAEARAAELQSRTEDLQTQAASLERRATHAERTAARMQALQEVTAALSSALTAADVAGIVVEKGVSALNAYAGSMVLLTSDGKTLERVRAIGYPEDMLARWKQIPIDGPYPLSEAVRDRTPVFIGDDRALSERYPHLNSERSATGTQAV